MTELSYEVLMAAKLGRQVSQAIIDRGVRLYEDDAVLHMFFTDENNVEFLVQGQRDVYEVTIGYNPKYKQLSFHCSCPANWNSWVCKHGVAAYYHLIDYFKPQQTSFEQPVRTIRADWEFPLRKVLAEVILDSKPVNQNGRYAVALELELMDRSYGENFQFSLRKLKLADFYGLEKDATADEINALWRQYPTWVYDSTPCINKISPTLTANIHPHAINLFNSMIAISSYSLNERVISNLRLLAELGVPFFFSPGRTKNDIRPISVLPEKVDISLAIDRVGDVLVLKPSLHLPPGTQPQKQLKALQTEGGWAVSEDYLFQLPDPINSTALKRFPMTIQSKEIDRFREQFLDDIGRTFAISGNQVQYKESTANLVPCLYLQEISSGKLTAEVKFQYGEREILPADSTHRLIHRLPGSWEITRYNRDLEAEDQYLRMLSTPSFGLKKVAAAPSVGLYELRAKTHPFDFLMYSIPKLTEAGFVIYGEEKLKSARINRSTPTLRTNITSGIDWFDLKVVAEFGDQTIPFRDLRKAIKKGEHYVKLADGSIGAIPEEWLQKYRFLWSMDETGRDHLEVKDYQLGLLDPLLEADQVTLPADFEERRSRLASFDRITEHPLPAGLRAELRPYQRCGFDWLHFLHDYRFGGILADDMGLGKTVQVLTLLQSLKESAPDRQPVSLLVVPKSLIANWQREADKFTPGMRILEYMGNNRSKETELFKDFDIILTTYGTMLRDAEILSGYQFHYIILDESQAIKNPLAKSAKAARLLKADHRLVMTGTPVENNTFELWSQFAFLNPGMLGSSDFFGEVFARPIENNHDEQALATLQRMIHPFILRRTKEQVAPELPERTERVQYIDLEPGQKKIYQHTREHYRSQLLGLIDSEGIENARMKILEGLLRLRQIAIHPRLADETYTGEAPKFDHLLETLETISEAGHKALVFSQFVGALHLLRGELDNRAISYTYLDGQTKNRQAEVDRFQTDSQIKIFLISLKAGGVGLNLTAADYVFHIDPWWNPAAEMQASDRAHRIGQQKPVFIYKLIARDTVEEKILELQEKKRALVKNLISSEAGFFKSLTREDVANLFG